jgi:invasion protein IalB
LVILVAWLPATAIGQDVTQIMGDWQLHCEAGDCRIRQGLANPDQSGVVYSSDVQFLADKDKVVLSLSFPLGLYLPPGVGLRVGDETRDVPMTVCLPTGCLAIVELDVVLLNALRSEENYIVRFYTASETPNEIKFSLDGFNDAYKDLAGRL